MAKKSSKIKAYTQFLEKDQSASFWKELAKDIGIDVTTLRRWSLEGNWVERKNEFFKKINVKVDEALDEVADKIAKIKIEFAQNIISGVTERFKEEIADIPIGTFKEMMQGIESAVNTVDKLLNLAPDSEKVETSLYASWTIEQKKQAIESINTIKLQVPIPTELRVENRDNIIDKELMEIKGDREQLNESNA